MKHQNIHLMEDVELLRCVDVCLSDPCLEILGRRYVYFSCLTVHHPPDNCDPPGDINVFAAHETQNLKEIVFASEIT